MKLILIDGGPASGKNTLGKIIVENFNTTKNKIILLDLDSYIEEFCPNWIWDNAQKKEKDIQNARVNFIKDINKYLKENFIVIAIGERFLTKKDVIRYADKLTNKYPIYLYHLSIPLNIRRKRLEQRGPHSLIDLDKDQKDRDDVKFWPGYVYENINTPKIDALNLEKLIKDGKGLVTV